MRENAFCRVCPVCMKRSARYGDWKHCWDCLKAARQAISRARRATYIAVLRGLMPHPATLKCADCAAPAFGYDHRDYDRPLDVAPVCRSCNWKRGPAKQLAPGFHIPAPQAAA